MGTGVTPDIERNHAGKAWQQQPLLAHSVIQRIIIVNAACEYNKWIDARKTIPLANRYVEKHVGRLQTTFVNVLVRIARQPDLQILQFYSHQAFQGSARSDRCQYLFRKPLPVELFYHSNNRTPCAHHAHIRVPIVEIRFVDSRRY